MVNSAGLCFRLDNMNGDEGQWDVLCSAYSKIFEGIEVQNSAGGWNNATSPLGLRLSLGYSDKVG